MSLFMKKIFSLGKRELTDEELIGMWKNSNRNVKAFEEFIMKIKNLEKRSECVIKEGSNIEIAEDNNSYYLNALSRIFLNTKQFFIANNLHKSKNYKRLVELSKRTDLYQGLLNILESSDMIASDKSKSNLNKVDDHKNQGNLLKTLNLHKLYNSNKYENLSEIINISVSVISTARNIDDTSDYDSNSIRNKLTEYLFDFYLNSQNEYFKCLEYFLLKSDDDENFAIQTLKFILPNKENCRIFQSKKFIHIKKTISNLFTNIIETTFSLNESDTTIFDLNLNILNYLNSESLKLDKEKKHDYSLVLLNLFQESNSDDQNFKLIKFLYDFYSIYSELFNLVNLTTQSKEKEKSFTQFINSDLYSSFNENLFRNLNKISKETFEEKIVKLFSFHKSNIKIIPEKSNLSKLYQNFLLIIYIQLLEIKSPIKFMSIYLNYLANYYTDMKKIKTISNLTLKLVIENLSDSYQNNLLLIEMLTQNNQILHCESLISELKLKINLIGILDKFKIHLSLNELVKHELCITNKNLDFNQSEIYKFLLEFFAKIAKNLRNFENYNFLEKNKESFEIVRKYLIYLNSILVNDQNLNKISFLDIVLDFLKNSQNFPKILAKIIRENPTFFTPNEIQILLDEFLQLRDKIKDNENLIEEYLEDLKKILKFLIDDSNKNCLYSEISKKFQHKLKNLSRLFGIAKVFSNNQIKCDFLYEFDHEKLNLNLANILEIFILTKFNIDMIEDISIFLERTKDIFEALEIDKVEYLYNIFLVFLKCLNLKFCVSLMKTFVETKNFKIFEKCLKTIKKSSTELNFNEFLIENGFDKIILEKSENLNLFEEIFTPIDFGNEKDLNFENLKLNYETEDILSFKSLEDKLKLESNQDLIELQIFRTKSDLTDDFSTLQNFNNFLSFYLERSETEFKTIHKNTCQDKNDKKKINFKYSLHPGLKEILDKLNFDYRGKEFEFNTKISFKTNLYKLLLDKRIVTSLEKILEFENFDFKRNKIYSYSEFFDLVKLLINIYDENTERIFGESEIFSKLKNISGDLLVKDGKEAMNNLTVELLAFNLQSIRHVNIYHMKFLQKVFEYEEFDLRAQNYFNDHEDRNFLMNVLNNLTKNKFCVLPYISYDHFNSLIQIKNFKDSIKSYYDEITVNVKYFTAEYNDFYYTSRSQNKSGNINDNLNLKQLYQNVEIYKHVSLHNFINLHKIFQIMEKTNLTQIVTLLVLKLFINIQNVLIVSLNRNHYKSSVREVIEIVKSLLTPLFTDDDEGIKRVIKIICFEICNFPNVNFILESHMSISILNKNTSTLLRNFLLVKMVLMEEISISFGKYVDRNYLIYDKYKILKIKNYIIQNLPEDEVKSAYEILKSLNEFSEIKYSMKNEKICREIERIFAEI